MTKHIFLQVCAGLANRLRATVSGIRAAEKLGCNITISWPKEAVFAATWPDLFESDLPAWIQFIDTPIKGARMCLTAEDFNRISNTANDIFIKSYGCFQPMDAKWLKWLRRFKARPEFLSEFGANPPVGLHIRRTDNVSSCMQSPTTAFYAAIQSLPAATKLFLATDDPKEREAVVQSYPGRVIVFPTECYHRCLTEGIQEAFREFVGLSRCAEIFGSVGSSFSELAAAYGDIPLRRISLDTLFQTGV